MEYQDKYSPVDPEFIDEVVKSCGENKVGKIHFFDSEGELADASGEAMALIEENKAEYIVIDQCKIRLDKVITLFGKPGPSYEEYDRYANACLTCENLGQF